MVSRPCHFAISEAFYDLINDLHKHRGVVQVKVYSITKLYILFILQSLKVGVLYILEHKKLNEKRFVKFMPTLRRRTHNTNTNFGKLFI